MSDPLEFLDPASRAAVDAYVAENGCPPEEAVNALIRSGRFATEPDQARNVVNEHLAQHRALGLKGDTET